MRTLIGSGSKLHALTLVPGTAIPGAAAFVGLVTILHLGGSSTAGMLSLARVASGFGAAALGSGPALAALRTLANGDDRIPEFRWAVLSHALVYSPLTISVGLFVVLMTGNAIGRALILGGALVAIDSMGLFEFEVLRSEKKFGQASILGATQGVASWAAASLAAAAHAGFTGVGVAFVLADLVAVLALSRHHLTRLDALATDQLRGTWSAVVTINVAGYALNNGDQYVIAALINPGAVAIYAIGYQLGGGVTSLLCEPLSGALGPRLLREWVDDPGSAARTARRGALGELTVGGLVAVAFGLAYVSGWLRLISPSSSLGPVAALIAVAAGLHAASSLAFVPPLFAARREGAWSKATWLTLVTAAIAVPSLTFAFGIIGTAEATIVGYLVLAALLYRASVQVGRERRNK